MIPKRGEVWWVRLDPTVGSEIGKTRPCVVLTSDILNQRRRTIVVVPISSSPKPSPPLLVAVQCAGRDGVAVVDQIRAAAKERFQKRIATLSEDELEAIEEGVREVLDFT